MLKSFWWSTISLAVLTFLASLGFQVMEGFRSEKLALFSFEPLAYAVQFLAGGLISVPHRYRGSILRFLERHSRWVAVAYAGAAGSIFGWGIGAAPAYIWLHGSIAFPAVTLICCCLFLLAVGPMWIFEAASASSQRFRGFMIRPRSSRNAVVLNLCGIATMGLSAYGFAMWAQGL